MLLIISIAIVNNVYIFNNIIMNNIIFLYYYCSYSSYLGSLIERSDEWAIAFRAGALLRGHHTNNFCEATMCIIKDVVLNRLVSMFIIS